MDMRLTRPALNTDVNRVNDDCLLPKTMLPRLFAPRSFRSRDRPLCYPQQTVMPSIIYSWTHATPLISNIPRNLETEFPICLVSTVKRHSNGDNLCHVTMSSIDGFHTDSPDFRGQLTQVLAFPCIQRMVSPLPLHTAMTGLATYACRCI